ncbi:MAG: sodium:solute symporter family protein [Anaerovoracaceae bacterium]
MLTMVDNIIVIIAFVGVVAVAIYFSKTVSDMESYFVCNKSLPWSLTVGTLVATWYGGVGTLGSVEWFALFGLSMFTMWCITAHVARIPLALWIGPSMQVRTDMTVPDVLRRTYGKKVALLGAVLMLIYSCQFGNITTSGFVGKVAWDAPYIITGAIVVAIVVVIAVAAGLMGVAVTDMIMFFFLGSAVAITVPIQWYKMGGWSAVEIALSDKPELLDPLGGLTVFQALTFMIIALAVYADPAFYQRFSASDSPKAGRRAMLMCLLIWVTMDIVLVATGMMVDVQHPELAPGLGYVTLVLETLPVGFRALFVVALIGSAISALDSYLLCGGTIMAYDIYGQLKKNATQKELLRLTRVSIVALGVIGLIVAFKVTVAMEIFLVTAAVWSAGGVVPITGALIYKGKKTPIGGMLSMLSGSILYLVLYFFPISGLDEPLPLCFALSFICYIIGNRFGKPLDTAEVLV